VPRVGEARNADGVFRGKPHRRNERNTFKSNFDKSIVKIRTAFSYLRRGSDYGLLL
jgi:hypothetical protein